MDATAEDWVFADAWVLTAVAVSAAPVSLTDVVAAADGLNHAILLEDELRSALAKLVGSGLLRVSDDVTFSLTGEGSDLVARRRGGHFSQVPSVERLLRGVPLARKDVPLASGVFQAAVAAYLSGRRAPLDP